MAYKDLRRSLARAGHEDGGGLPCPVAEPFVVVGAGNVPAFLEAPVAKPGGEVRALAVSPSGDLLAVSRFIRYVRGGINFFLFDLQTGKTLASKNAYYPTGANSITFSADGKEVATTGAAGEVKLWQVLSEKDK